MITAEEIEAAKSPSGGYTKATLAQWGISWPPPRGWKDALMSGATIERSITPSVVRPSMDANELLRQVVMAVIERGHGSDLWDFSDVLAHFGSQHAPDAVGPNVVSDTRLPDAPF